MSELTFHYGRLAAAGHIPPPRPVAGIRCERFMELPLTQLAITLPYVNCAPELQLQ
ncbi:MAG: hypothetical protein AB1801_10585 [Chloroflexota bacterium]